MSWSDWTIGGIGQQIQDWFGTGDSSAREQNQKNRDFQERMADSELQRRMADAKKAGLNPILAVGTGGASSPSGNAGAGGQASSAIGKITSSAINAFQNWSNKPTNDDFTPSIAKGISDIKNMQKMNALATMKNELGYDGLKALLALA